MPDYPDDLVHPISRGDASLLGIGWRELSGPLWRAPYRGVHVWSATDPHAPLQRAFDAAALLPDDGALGGWAACQVGGATELDGRGPWGQDEQPVLLCLPSARRLRRGRGVRPLRSCLEDSDIAEVCGVRVTTPLRTAFDLARSEPFVEAVVAIDYLARGRPEFLDELARYMHDHRHFAGSRRARSALSRSSFRSRSGGETRLRLLWTIDAGLPEPQVNASVRTGDGFILGMTDLLDDEAGLAGEYDGSTHRQPGQHARDNVREEGLESGGLVVVRFGGVDLGQDRRRAVHRLHIGRRRAIAQPAAARKWTWVPGPLPDPTHHW